MGEPKIAWAYMVKERNSAATYCPLNTEGSVMVGMSIVGSPFRGADVVGEYWFEGQQVHMKLYKQFQELEDLWKNRIAEASLPDY